MKKRLIKILTVSLCLLVLASCFVISPSAATADFSVGYGDSSKPVFTGLVDYIVSVETTSGKYGSFVINPIVTESMIGSDNPIGDSGSFPYQDVSFDFNSTYSNPDLFPLPTSDLSDPDTALGCNFDLGVGLFSGEPNCSFSKIRIEARDFYWMLNPNYEDVHPDSDDEGPLCEGLIELRGNSRFGLTEIEMDYYEAGTYDDLHSYSTIVSGVDDASSFFLTIPQDESLGGVYDDFTLIYVDYLCMTIQVDPVSDYDDFISLTGYYLSFNGDFRNVDLDSVTFEPSPMDPGIFADYTSWIGTALGGFLDLEIVSGFTLGGILMTIIGFLLAIWFLKLLAGG